MAIGLRSTSQLPDNLKSPGFPQRINRQNRNMAAVPPASVADSWVDNPNVDNFNIRTKAGQEIF